MTTDPEVRRAQGLALAVRAEAHKMRTLVRFLPVPEGNAKRYLGWYDKYVKGSAQMSGGTNN